MCPFHYSKTIKLVNKKKLETNAAKKCSKMFHLIAYLGQRVGKKATTHTQTTIGWKCLPGCVFSPCWASIYNQNTIKAFLIAYLGQGADEKATTQAKCFWKCFFGRVFSCFWPSRHIPNTIKTLLLIAYLGPRALAWICDQSTWAKAFLQCTIRIQIWKREKKTNTENTKTVVRSVFSSLNSWSRFKIKSRNILNVCGRLSKRADREKYNH